MIFGKDGLVDRLPILGWKLRGYPLWALMGCLLMAIAFAPAWFIGILFLLISERTSE